MPHTCQACNLECEDSLTSKHTHTDAYLVEKAFDYEQSMCFASTAVPHFNDNQIHEEYLLGCARHAFVTLSYGMKPHTHKFKNNHINKMMTCQNQQRYKTTKKTIQHVTQPAM
jgi:hypothetical protein